MVPSGNGVANNGPTACRNTTPADERDGDPGGATAAPRRKRTSREDGREQDNAGDHSDCRYRLDPRDQRQPRGMPVRDRPCHDVLTTDEAERGRDQQQEPADRMARSPDHEERAHDPVAEERKQALRVGEVQDHAQEQDHTEADPGPELERRRRPNGSSRHPGSLMGGVCS